MYPDEASNLLDALKSGKISAADLSGEQFQTIIFHKLIEQCEQNNKFSYELIDNYRGAVDFVIREKPSQISQFHTEDPVHVFECKYYRRTLELSTVAKLLVVGVRFQPTSLNIVSGTNLQPQVYEYARLLFSGLGNDAAMFRRTFFRHYRTSDLLELEVDCDDSVENLVTEIYKSTKGKVNNISWELAELRPFSEKIIADSYKRNVSTSLDGRWIHKLRISLFTFTDPKTVKYWIEGESTKIIKSSSLIETTKLSDGQFHIRFTQIIDPRVVKRLTDTSLVIHITCGSLSHYVSTIPVVIAPGSDKVYTDLRQKETDEFATLLQQREAPRLLLLGGEAGVGKTYLCESIAEKLQLIDNFEINRFSLNLDVDASFLYMMLVTVCTPAAARTENSEEWQKLADSLIEVLSPVSRDSPEHSSPIKPSEILIPVLAELLVKAGPRLLILRDAHLLTEPLAREIGALIGRLNDLGWGDVYCIIEHRTSRGTENLHWNELEAKIRSQIDGYKQQQLTPLSIKELYNFLDHLFTYITPDLKNLIWKLCGGIPLYLFSVLGLLHEKRAIIYDDNKRFTIKSPSAFVNLNRTHRKADGVLEAQLKGIMWAGTNLPRVFEKTPLLLVGLLAIAQEPMRVKRLCQITDIDLNSLRSARRTLIRYNVIVSGDKIWEFDFQHDLLRRTAIEISRNADSGHAVVEQILARLQEDEPTVSDLELYADIAAWAGFREDANQALNTAFERLNRSENFSLISRILTKLREGLEPEAFSSSKRYSEYLTCRSALAWTLWNSGSLIEARLEYLNIAADALSGANTVIDITTAETYAADAQRRVVGLNLALNDIPNFIESARSTLELSGHSGVFNSIMNRLILYCARYGHVNFGLELSAIALEVLGEIVPESAAAVLCSDIGALFRSAEPDKALTLYHRGVELATDSRQRIYNELDVLITERMLGLRQYQADELDTWRRRLVENGLRSMLTRFDTFCASVAVLEGQFERAKKLYQHVEMTDSIFRGGSHRLDLLNDRMVAAFAVNDIDEAHRLQKGIISKLTKIFEQRPSSFELLQALRPLIEKQKKRFLHLRPLDIDISFGQPAYSGLLIPIVLNLETLAQARNGIASSMQKKVAELCPSDIDHSKALETFNRQSLSNRIEFNGVKLMLCAQ